MSYDFFQLTHKIMKLTWKSFTLITSNVIEYISIDEHIFTKFLTSLFRKSTDDSYDKVNVIHQIILQNGFQVQKPYNTPYLK